jgi:hypothetical protein
MIRSRIRRNGNDWDVWPESTFSFPFSYLAHSCQAIHDFQELACISKRLIWRIKGTVGCESLTWHFDVEKNNRQWYLLCRIIGRFLWYRKGRTEEDIQGYAAMIGCMSDAAFTLELLRQDSLVYLVIFYNEDMHYTQLFGLLGLFDRWR